MTSVVVTVLTLWSFQSLPSQHVESVGVTAILWDGVASAINNMNGTEYDKGKQDGEILQQLKDINNHLINLSQTITGQEKRIRALENWKWWMLSGNITIGVGAAKVASAFFI